MAKYRTASRQKVLQVAKERKNISGRGCLTTKEVGSDVQFWKPTKSVHNLDIIGFVITNPNHPDCDGENLAPGYLWHSMRYFIHRNIGAENATVVCPAQTWGKKCPICEYANMRRSSGEADVEELRLLRPSARQLFNVIDRDADPHKIVVWDVSYALFGDLLYKELMAVEDTDAFDFFFPEGKTIRVRFEKKSFNSREFYNADRIDFKDRKPYPEDIVEKAYALDKMLVERSYDQINQMFVLGVEPMPDEEHTEQIKAQGSPRDPNYDIESDSDRHEALDRKRRKRLQEDKKQIEEENREDMEDEQEEEEKEQPKRHMRRPMRRPEPVEEDDSNDDEEEEEEEEEPESHVDRCKYKHTWGKDCDKYDDCDSCTSWGACNAARNKKR